MRRDGGGLPPKMRVGSSMPTSRSAIVGGAASGSIALPGSMPVSSRSDTTDTGITQSEYKDVASYIFTPIVVTQANVADTVIADGFYEAAEICTGEASTF